MARPKIAVSRASTLQLAIHRVDWAAVIAGTKTQFRRAGVPRMTNVEFPQPVVLTSTAPFRDKAEGCLAVLEDVFREPLGAITAEGLAAEGVESLKDFRHYWAHRHGTGFRPLTIVNVFTLSVWRDGDRERFAELLLLHLYGPWL